LRSRHRSDGDDLEVLAHAAQLSSQRHTSMANLRIP
jgi:hypothetical protein